MIGVTAFASPINITVDSAGALLNGVGIANDTQYGQGNNNPSSNLAFLNSEIGNWNGAFSPDLPLAVGPVAHNDENLDLTSYTLLSGYDYVVFHFGAGPATPKSQGGWWQAFYLGGLGGNTFNLPTLGGKSVGGYSSARYFDGAPVAATPDESVTLVLFGLSLVGIAFGYRRIKSN